MALRREAGEQRIDNLIRGKVASRNWSPRIAGFDQQQAARAICPREPSRKRIGGHVPRRRQIVGDERHMRGKPDWNFARFQSAVHLSERPRENEGVRMRAEHNGELLHGEKRHAMCGGVIKP